MDKMIEEFEVWAEWQGYATDKYLESDLSDKYKNLAGIYVIQETRLMLEVWKASRAALCVELPLINNVNGVYYDFCGYDADMTNEALDKAGVSYK